MSQDCRSPQASNSLPVKRLPSPDSPGDHMFRLLGMSLVGMTLAGCGGGGAAGPTQPVGVLTSLEVSPASVLLVEGGTVQLTVTPMDQAGKVLQELPAASFSSSDSAVASVAPNGLVSALQAGVASIQVSLSADGVTKSTTVSVTVTRGSLPGGSVVTTVGVTFNPASIAIPMGDSVSWRFQGAVHNVTFSGAAPPGGNIPDQQVGAVVSRTFSSAGTYPYECTIHSGMSGEVVVTSAAPAVYSALLVSPSTPSLELGQSVTLTATPLDQHGSAMSGLPAATWQSSDPSIATVTSSGVVDAVAAGTVDIVATLTAAGVSHTDAATVTVLSQQPGSATVTTPNRTFSPPSVVIPPGGTVIWQFSQSTHNVTFAGSAPPGGSIPDQSPGNSVSRTFPTEGTYAYACTLHTGMTGTVSVQAGPPPPPPPGLVVTAAQAAFTPDRVEVAPGETVTWLFSDDIYNVTFTGPAPPGGNIPDANPGSSVSRTFPASGDYDYECTLHPGMGGRIRVR